MSKFIIQPGEQTVSLDAITLHPGNARKGDIPAIMDSLQRFGQYKRIVVQASTGYVLAGNHTLMAAQRLGWSDIDVKSKDVSDDEATKILLADNRSSDRARYKKTELNDLLQQTLDLDGTGYDQDDLDELEDSLTPGDGAPTGTAPSAAPKPAPKRAEQKREVVLLMAQSQSVAFGLHIAWLQKQLGTNAVVDTLLRVVEEAAVANGFETPAAEKPKPKPRAKGAAAKAEAQAAVSKPRSKKTAA